MLDAVTTLLRDLPAGRQRALAMKRLSVLVAGTLSLAGCATHERLTAQDTRAENVDHQRLQVRRDGGGAGAVEAYALRPTEGYRMPQLHTAPPPVLGNADPRQELAPTRVCLQLVVDAEGRVERSLPLADRPECEAGTAAITCRCCRQRSRRWRCGGSRPPRSAIFQREAHRAMPATATAPSGSSRYRSACSTPSPLK